MRSDKTPDIAMNYDSIAATPLDVSYGDSVTSASDLMEIADHLARLEGLPATQIAIRETVLQVGPLELDLIERTAERAGRTIDLLPKEFRLLRYMMQHSDLLLTRARCLKRCGITDSFRRRISSMCTWAGCATMDQMKHR